jgi:DNA-binding transcriptional LysR family regulator
LDLNWLEDFQALEECGNFSRAALLRNMTQPAFSRRIRALEHWAGVQLFERDVQPVVLTNAGRSFQPAVAEILRRLQQARQDAQAAVHRGRATLHFAATHVLSFSFFPGWLRGLESGQPLEAVQLVSDSLRACEQFMLQAHAQFLLCHHHAQAPARLDGARFRSIRVGGDVLCPVAAPDAFGAPRFKLDRTGAGPVPYLAYSNESGLGRIVAAALPLGSTDVQLDPVFTSHLAAALKTMAETGRGVAWLPKSLIEGELTQGRLVSAGSEALEIAVDIRLFRQAADLGPAAERFWALIAKDPV